jgi:hypothetical protein
MSDNIVIIEEQSLEELIYSINDKGCFVLEEIVKSLGIERLKQIHIEAPPRCSSVEAFELGKMLEQTIVARQSLRKVLRENEGWESGGLH